MNIKRQINSKRKRQRKRKRIINVHIIPGHALHEKGLQRQIAVGTLVNSQQRRALAVPRLNRWSTAGEPLVNRTFCSSTGLHRISFVRACEETFIIVVYGTLEG